MSDEAPIDMTDRQADVLYAVMGSLPTRLAGLTHDDVPSEDWERLKRQVLHAAGTLDRQDAIDHGVRLVARYVADWHARDHRQFGEAVYEACIQLLGGPTCPEAVDHP